MIGPPPGFDRAVSSTWAPATRVAEWDTVTCPECDITCPAYYMDGHLSSAGHEDTRALIRPRKYRVLLSHLTPFSGEGTPRAACLA